jgi:hypothetical protein
MGRRKATAGINVACSRGNWVSRCYSSDVRPLLIPVVLPYICHWIARQEQRILAAGVALSDRSLADACAIGVGNPERVRLLRIQTVPLPGGPMVRFVGKAIGAPWEHTAGLTAQYGIFIHDAFWGDRRLVAHELAHTAQYERLGGVRPFLRRYLHECLTVGYSASPLEFEAIEAAARLCP